MLSFKPVSNICDIEILKEYSLNEGNRFASFSLADFFMWRELFPAKYCVSDGTLVVKFHELNNERNTQFMLPAGRDKQSAIIKIEDYCKINHLPLVFCGMTLEDAHKLCDFYPMTEIFYDRNFSDYLYTADSMQKFAGKKYAGQRNHINKFTKLYGEPVYKEFTPTDKERAKEFIKFIEINKNPSLVTEKEELKRIPELIDNMDILGLFGGFLEKDGKIIAMSMGFVRDDTLFVTIEKADRTYEGIYPTMVREFARHNATGTIKYINRADDMGLEGLRTSKLQYQPTDILHKYCVKASTLIDRIEQNAVIESEDIVLDDVRKKDLNDYFALCSDKDNNKYWGYDYAEDKDFCNTPQYYMDFAKKMRETGEECSFALRYEGEFAGEVVLHGFDFRGGAEIGIRLLTKYHGRGIATKTVNLTCRYLKDIGAKSIRMKCMHQNISSFNMIKKAGFKETRRDDKYIYFEYN